MVSPLRTIFYGIPILVVGTLAALPFRRAGDPEPTAGVEQPSPVDDWAIEPVEEISATEFDEWGRQRSKDPVDPMQAMVASLPPLPDSYQAVAVPLQRPSKIANRFSAVASDERTQRNPREPLGPLVGHPAELVSTGIRRSVDDSPPSRGWRTAIPIGRPSSSQEPIGDDTSSGRLVNGHRPAGIAAPAETSAPLPAPRPTLSKSASEISETSEEPWPTVEELAAAKQTKRSPPCVVEANGPEKPAEPSDASRAAFNGITPASSISQTNDRSSSAEKQGEGASAARERRFIREPTGDERG